MSPTHHELRRMIRGKVPLRSKCDQCDKRRVMVDGMHCRACYREKIIPVVNRALASAQQVRP